MTEALTIIDSPIGPVVPVNEVAKSIGYSRSAISNAIHKPENAALFAPFILTVRVKGKAGYRDRLCIAKAGLDELISHLRPIERDGLPARIATFRAAQMQKNTFSAPPLSDILTEYGKRARALSSEWGVDPGAAQRVTMADAVEKYPDLMPYRALVGPVEEAPKNVPALPAPAQDDLPKADPDFEKYYSMEKLAAFCQCSRDEAHNILEKESVIECVNKVWRLTRYGARFGKMFPHYPLFPHRMTERWMIRYNPEAIQLVRGKLFGTQIPLAEFGRKSPTEPQKAGMGAG